MAKGSAPQTQTNTTTQQLSPEQQEVLGLAMPSLRQFAANPPRLYEGNTVAEFDPSQTAGQEQALQAASGYSSALTDAQGGYNAAVPGLNQTGQQAANTYGMMTSGQLLSPESNPYLKAHMDSAISSAAAPIWQGLSESVLPNIRGSAVQTGYGGSRQGIAEGLASGRAAQEVGRQGQGIATSLADAGYGRGLDAMGRALGLTSQVQGAQTAGADAQAKAAQLAGEQINPALWTSAVGDIRQGRNQSLIDQEVARWNYEQQLPLLMGRELAGISAGLPGGSTTVTGTGTKPASGNPFTSTLGGAVQGATLGSMFLPGIGTAAGALGGAGLGYLGSRY